MVDESQARIKAERDKRLAAALRENLRRRKAQARERAAHGSRCAEEKENLPAREFGEAERNSD